MEIVKSILITEIILCLVIYNTSPVKLKVIDYINIIINSIIVAIITNHICPRFVSLIIFSMPIYIFYTITTNIFFSSILTFISVIIFIISNHISNFIVLSIFKIKLSYSYNIAMVLIIIILLLVSFFISKFVGNFIKRNIHVTKNKDNKKVTVLVFLAVVMTFVIFYCNTSWTSYGSISDEIVGLNIVLFFTYFVLMIISVVTSLSFYNKELEVINKQQQLNNLQEYASDLEYLYNDVRKFKHDYINIISSIIGYIDEKDLEGLEKHLYNNIIPASKKIESNNNNIGRLNNLKVLEIKGIMASKLLKAQEMGIDVFIDVAEPIDFIDMDIIDLSRCIGIILDNAIEGTLESKEKSIKVAIIKKSNSIIIVVSNSCTSNIVPIYKLYKAGFSTKGENRGLGLSNLREILKKYNNVIIDTIIENNDFIQNIQITNNQLEGK